MPIDPVLAAPTLRAYDPLQDRAGQSAKLGGQPVVGFAEGAVDLGAGAEEAGMHMAEKFKALFEREDIRTPETELVPDIAAIVKLWQEFDEKQAGPEGFDALQARLLQAARAGGSILALVSELAPDPARQYLLLAATWERAQRDAPLDTTAQERLAEALDELEERTGPQIRADLNTVAQAKAFSPLQARRTLFRSRYRHVISTSTTEKVAVMFDQVLDSFGAEDFEKGVKLLLQAVGQDLNAQRPSVDPVRLHAAQSKIYLLQSCITVLLEAERVENVLRKSGIQAQAILLAKGVVGLCGEAHISPHPLVQLLERFEPRHRRQSRQLMTLVLDMVRMMPPKLFASAEERLDWLDVARDLLVEFSDEKGRS